MSEYLKLKEAAHLCGANERTLKRAIERGELRAGRSSPGGPYLIKSKDLEHYIYSNNYESQNDESLNDFIDSYIN